MVYCKYLWETIGRPVAHMIDELLFWVFMVISAICWTVAFISTIHSSNLALFAMGLSLLFFQVILPEKHDERSAAKLPYILLGSGTVGMVAVVIATML